MLKGNHDYWWTTVTNMRKYLLDNGFEKIDFLYNNSYKFENYVIVGTRGWSALEDGNLEKMIKREVARLELSFEDGIKKYGKNAKNYLKIISFMLYCISSKLKQKDGELC